MTGCIYVFQKSACGGDFVSLFMISFLQKSWNILKIIDFQFVYASWQICLTSLGMGLGMGMVMGMRMGGPCGRTILG